MAPLTQIIGLLLSATTIAQAQSSLVTSAAFSSSTGSATSQTPCSSVSSISAAFAAASPGATGFLVDARIAYECLQSVPIVKQDALDLVDGLAAFWQFQSTTAYLADPPSDYQYPAVNLTSGLEDITKNINEGSYSGEYEFQKDILELMYSTHDGHMNCPLDLFNVFSFFTNGPGSLVSISEDGQKVPKVYLSNDVTASSGSIADLPSIDQINGRNVTEYLQTLANSTRFQDMDTTYNQVFYDIAFPTAPSGVFVTGINGYYLSDETVFTYSNGSTFSFPVAASSVLDFTGVDSGEAFYEAFCMSSSYSSSNYHGSQKNDIATRSSESFELFDGYPEPMYQSTDASVSGYFLNGTKYEDTAVLFLSSFSGNSPAFSASVQSTIEQFLLACTKASKTKLIIDLSSNGGGSVFIGYDLFKQLFPTLNIDSFQNMRAMHGTYTLGSTISNFTARDRMAVPVNTSKLLNDGGYNPWDADTFLTPNMTNSTWDGFYGPNSRHGDSFTNIFLSNVENSAVDMANLGIDVSGFGSRAKLAPQPFNSENIILFSNGACSSTCTTFSHLMKWQAKVRSVAMGGLPRAGPMQQQGGVKGARSYYIENLAEDIFEVEQELQILDYAAWNATELGIIASKAIYMISRTLGTLGPGPIGLNLWNQIGQDDESFTPMQFRYEAADCRLYFTPKNIFNATQRWVDVADVTWGSDTAFASGCVPMSTNAASSLSGNAALYDNGKIQNVTASEIPTESGDSSYAKASGLTPSEGIRMGASMNTLVLAVGFGVLILIA